MTDWLICVATELEQCGLPEVREIGGRSVEVLRTGVGPVNAAMALTRRLARGDVGRVLSLGIGGAYPGSDLKLEEVVCASRETYGDLGVDSQDGFLDMEDLGFEVVAGYFNELPLDVFPCEHRRPFVTLATCTGRQERALEIARRTGGAVESMEGAALVHVALAHGLPIGEIRGISNAVGDRDRSRWRVKEAARAAGMRLLAFLEEGSC